MATTRLWLNLTYELTCETCEMFKHCTSCKAKTLHVSLPVFCIAISQSVPIFEEVTSSSG